MSIKRVILNINGIDREVMCNVSDSLTDVLRRLGLTGTKAACRAGHCGACSILLDGKLVRACIRKMKSIKDFTKIETIEGFGTPDNLHPLQQAFLTYAAIQCGFCSPGFIVSAKALLNENPNPTRKEVRDWFTKNNNICRCTGYKPIVDAVIEAAAVMRGEKSMSDIMPKLPEDGQIYGTNFVKPSGVTRVLGTCDFGADIALKMPVGSLHLAPVLSKIHSGRLKSVNSEKALSMPGVKAVITAKDVKGTNRFFAPQGVVHSLCHGNERPVIIDDKIYRYGDVIAVVAANSREEARAAAKEVTYEYTELPAAMNFIEAVAQDAPQVFDDMPNIYMEQPLYKGDDTKDIFEKAFCVVEASSSTTRQSHLPIEPDVVQAYPEENGGIAIQCKTQFTYGVIGQMAKAIGLENDKIRIIGNPAGGSFGYSMSPANYALVAVCTLALDAPVSMDLSYEEHQHMTGKRAPIHANARLACDEKGKLIAFESLIGLDHGAYSEMAGALTAKVHRFLGYGYNIPNMRSLTRTAFTNTNFGTAYRAFGSPQAYSISEPLVDMLAEKMNMDQFEFRYQNLIQEGDLAPTCVPYREYPMQGMMDIIRPYYEEAKERAATLSTDKVKRGVGLAVGGYHVSKMPEHSEVDLEIRKDGVTVYATWADVGQGADFGLIAHVHEALRVLKITPEQIRMVNNDTAQCPDTGSASGSRSHHVAGHAIIHAAEQMINTMKKEDGTFRTFEEMQAEKLPTRFHGVYHEVLPDIDPDTGHGYGSVAQNYLVTLTEVEVDVETGKTQVLDTHICADIGTIGSYHAVLGQAWGGFSHCVGFALSENYEDMDKHATLKGAGVPSCNDVPDNMHVHFHTTPRKNGPQGSTGCAEAFQSSGHVAILNAINDAVGVRITTIPATPKKVKEAMEAKAGGEPYMQERWDLGCELHERLEYLHNKHVVK